MTDPLSLLREFNIKKKKVYVDGTHLVFGNLTCPRSTETNFKQQSRSKYYTIESIWFFLKNIDVPHLKYVLLASNEKINPVSLPDRNLLAQYLRGQISTCKSIDPNKFPGVLTKVYKRQSKDLTEISEPQAPSQKLLKEKFSLIEQSEDQSVSTVKPLSEKLTAEKILELKAHRQARKQLTGGKTDAEDLTIGSSFIQTDASISQRIISLERSFHTRDSVMMAQSLLAV
ncbi:parafibromin-like [Zophobas morio]|uniref:parafibromin-like n=1 Tax=Zophobas morio TaxID=2755281 RepID=UPI003082A66B